MVQMSLFISRNRDTDVENKRMDTKGDTDVENKRMDTKGVWDELGDWD